MILLDREIPPLGMGCWAIGGPFFAGDEPLGYAGTDDGMSIRTVEAAYEAGIRLFDTAAVYGAGHAERLLGRALKSRDDVLIMSKLGTAFDEETKQILHDETEPAQIEAAIDASRRRLDRDRIDVMFLHLNSLPVTQAMALFNEMERARAAGKIGAYGWSTDFPGSVNALAGRDGVVGIQHAMSVFLDVPTIQAAIENADFSAFIRSPLAMGILTGKFDAESIVGSDDVRAIDSERRDYFRGGKAAPKHLRNLDAIRELLQTGGRSLAQGAIGWLWAKSPRNIPLPGARTPAQARENAGALTHGPLPTGVMAEIETLIQRDPEGPPRAR